MRFRLLVYIKVEASLLFMVCFLLNFHMVYRDGGELSTRDLQRMVQALPQYSEQIDKLSLHVEVSSLFMRDYYLVK